MRGVDDSQVDREKEGEKEESEKGGRERRGGLRHGGSAYARENTYTTTPGCAYPRPVVVPVSLSLSLRGMRYNLDIPYIHVQDMPPILNIPSCNS